MTTRIVSGSATLALVLLTGCGSQAPPPAKAPPAPTLNVPAAGTTSSTTAQTDVLAAAHEFLTAADKGSPDVAKVTSAFKQLIGPADKPGGYSDWAAEQWLKEQLTGKVKTIATWSGSAAPDTVIVAASDQAPTQPRRVVLRMVKHGTGFLVDWVHVAPAQDRLNLGAGDSTAMAFAAQAFLDTLVTGQPTLAESLLTPAFKARLAPPLNDPLGYNRAMLGIKLVSFRGKATEWKGALSDMTMTGQLVEIGKERPFTLKLAKGSRPGEWLVEDFDVK